MHTTPGGAALTAETWCIPITNRTTSHADRHLLLLPAAAAPAATNSCCQQLIAVL
jgi:hypothetical protein